MAKNKLKRFKEMKEFPHVFEPVLNNTQPRDFKLKGKWNSVFFENSNPIILELGCGKGEYTVNLAEKFPEKNFIGMDIKGARMWVGSKASYEKKLKNIAFVRSRIEFIKLFFAGDEVSEIWLTFPDPQIKKLRKRLSAARYLNSYQQIMKQGGIVHIKTDSNLMFGFTKDIISFNQLQLLDECSDIYSQRPDDELLTIKTFYELTYLLRNLTIKYLKFQLRSNEIINPKEDQKRLENEIETRKKTGTNRIVRMQNIY